MSSGLHAHWVGFAFLALGLAAAWPAAAAQDMVLFSFGPGFDLASVGAHGATVSLAPRADGATLRLATGHAEKWPGIVLKAPDGHWDLSQYERVSATVKNAGTGAARVGLRVDNPGADGKEHCVQVVRTLAPGESMALTAVMQANGTRFSSPVKLVGMRGVPGGSPTMDPANVTQLLLFADRPDADYVLELEDVRAAGSVRTIDAASFFPFIDEFGQYIHADWPGKTHSDEDLKAASQAEAADLEAHPGPEDWDRLGGWAAGPQLEATGFFRAQKHEGKWWLVDPDGRLFWSHGIDCVRSTNAVTPITDAAQLLCRPARRRARRWRASTAGRGVRPTATTTASVARHLRLRRGEPLSQVRAGLRGGLRRHRPPAPAQLGHEHHRQLVRRRHLSGAQDALRRNRSAIGARQIEGSEGYWGKFPDVFDPGFRADLAAAHGRTGGKSAGDPWCIGYFVDNETGLGRRRPRWPWPRCARRPTSRPRRPSSAT